MMKAVGGMARAEKQIPFGDDKALRAVLYASRKTDEHEQPKCERLQKILAAAGFRCV